MALTDTLLVAGDAADRKSSDRPSIMPFVVATMLQRIAIWIGALPLSISLMVTPATLAVQLYQGRVSISYIRLALFIPVAMSSVISFLISKLYNDVNASIFSCLTFIVVYAVFTFEYNLNQDKYYSYYSRIVAVVAIICVAGAMQFFGQAVIGGGRLFTWSWFVPSSLLTEYNTINKIGNLLKSNGFFLLEASALSQLAGRTLLVVWLLFPNARVTALLGLGLLISFSGTGLIFAGLFAVPVILWTVLQRKSYFMVAAIILPLAGAFVILFGQEYLRINYFVGRTSEFTTEGTSGYFRFTSNFIAFGRYVLADPVHAIFGYGPGTEAIFMQQIAVGALASCWIKLALENGILGLVSFAAFMYYCFFRTMRSHFAAFAFLFHYLFLDGTLLVPQHAFVAYFLSAAVCPRSETGSRSSNK